MGEKSCNLKRLANKKKRNKPSWMTYGDCTFFNHPIFPTVFQGFFTSIFNTLSPHMMYHMFEKE